jgi:hypothetical protein
VNSKLLENGTRYFKSAFCASTEVAAGSAICTDL